MFKLTRSLGRGTRPGSLVNVQCLRRILIVANAIITISLLTLAPPHKPESSNLIKGVWMTHLGTSLLSYTTAIDNIFHQLSNLNFNRVYVDVYNGGTIYPSQYVSRNYKISLPFTDPLKTAIKKGNRQGLKIYAWYEHGMMLFPDDSLAKQHPDWLLTTSDGQQFIENHVWLDPNNAQVQEYFVNLFTEVAKKYPHLEGIQVDDHWGIPIVFGNKVQAMNKLTNKVFTAIKEVRSDLIISVSPNHYNFAYKNYSQDWLAWVKQGLVDEIIVQIYRPNTQQVIATLLNGGLRTASKYIPVAVGIYVGNRYQNKPLAEIKSQISTVQQYNYGYSLFCWENLFTPLHKGSNQEKEAIFK